MDDATDGDSPFQSSTFGRESSCITVNEDVGSMSISPCGRDVVLGSKRGLFVIDLDSPYEKPRFLPHQSSWEVADVQWSVHAFHEKWIVSTSNQKAIIWNLYLPSRNAIEHVLNGHSRAITDINWSPFDPEILATCGVDAWVQCWDLRCPRKTVQSFCDWHAAATQVKWSRQDSDILASTHDRFLHIWDRRHGAMPLITIKAHDTSIRGLDWNRIRRTGVVTCSLDKSVKFWDYEKGCEPEKVLHTSYPVWRARHTPFGWGLLTMPQRGDTTLHLWDRRADGVAPFVPVAEFAGHSGQVKEFLWRSRGSLSPSRDDREFQLVTYGADHQLRLWKVSDSTLEAIGHNPDKPTPFKFTRKGAKYITLRKEPELPANRFSTNALSQFSPVNSMRGSLTFPNKTRHSEQRDKYMTRGSKITDKISALMWMKGVHVGRLLNEEHIVGWDLPENLGEELAMIGHKFPKIDFEDINLANRTCILSLNGPWGDNHGPKYIFIRMEISCPPAYPELEIPEVKIEKSDELSEDKRTELQNGLISIATLHLNKRRPCIEACLRYLLGEKAADAHWILDSDESSSSDDESDESLLDDVNDKPLPTAAVVPVPRNCAAIFAPNGLLVCLLPPKRRKSNFFSRFGKLYGKEDTTKGFSVFGQLGSENEESDSEISDIESMSDLEDAVVRADPPWGLRTLKKYYHRRSKYSSDASNRDDYLKFLPKNVCSIRDIGQFEPVKKVLAEEYIFCCSKEAMCTYNADIAGKYGFEDRKEAWTLAGLIMSNGIGSLSPNAQIQKLDVQDCILPEASYQRATLYLPDKIDTRPNCGDHSMNRWFIENIFDYFKLQKDIQMLAMLTLVFSENLPQSFNGTVGTTFKCFTKMCPTCSTTRKSTIALDRLLPNNYWQKISGTYSIHHMFRNENMFRNHNMDTGPSSRGSNSSISPEPHIISRNFGFYPLDKRSSVEFARHPLFPYTDNIGENRKSNVSNYLCFPGSSEESRNALSFTANNEYTMSSKTILRSWISNKVRISFAKDNLEEIEPNHWLLLDPSKREEYSIYILAYANTMFNFNLRQHRLELLKYSGLTKTNSVVNNDNQEHSSLKFGVRCTLCAAENELGCQKRCQRCNIKLPGLSCAYCGLTVRQLAVVCLKCSHGGHKTCIARWFELEDDGHCPSGCGCKCLESEIR